MRFKLSYFRVFVSSILLCMVVSCKHNPDYKSNVKGVGVPNEEGIPISFVSKLPATLIAEVIKNLYLIADLTNPDGKFSNMHNLPVSFKCEKVSATENHCLMTYTGQELALELTELFFGTMSGGVFLRRGCNSQDCTTPPMRLWLRTRTYTHLTGKKRHDVEVCSIKGLEAAFFVNNRFRFLADHHGSMGYKPDIHGFRASVEEFPQIQEQFDDYGYQKFDSSKQPVMGPGVGYQMVEAFAGLGPIGPFPTNDCLLTGDIPDKVKVPSQNSWTAGKMPQNFLKDAPGKLVKFTVDALDKITVEAQAQSMNINFICQKQPDGPTCAMNYRGPFITIPIPSYITGVVSGNIDILRRCTNPGCKQFDVANIKMRSYKKDGLSILEVCSMEGFELSNYTKIPLQKSLFGEPDLKGAVIAIDDKTPGFPELSRLNIGVSRFGAFPNSRCIFL